MFHRMHLPAIPSEYIEGEEVPRGLSLHPEFLDGSAQESLLREVEGLSWDRSGYNPEHLGHFQFGPPSFRFRPRWARTLGNQLHQLGYFRDTPNSVFLFQYPHQMRGSHFTRTRQSTTAIPSPEYPSVHPVSCIFVERMHKISRSCFSIPEACM